MPEATRPLRVFLCHAKEDKPVVHELYQRLDAEGWIDAWLDEIKILPGQEWDIEIERAVEIADVVLVCLSTYSVDKEGYVQKELRFVLNIADEKPEGTIFIVPLRLDDCQVPRRLRPWQWVDFYPKNQRKTAYLRLLESLKLRAGKLGISAHKPTPPAIPVDNDVDGQSKAREHLAAQKAENERVARQKAKAERDRLARQKAEELRKMIAEVFRKINFKSIVAIGVTAIAWFAVFFLGNVIIENMAPTPTQPSEVSEVIFSSSIEPSTTTLLLGADAGSTWTSPKDGMTLLYIPAGKYLMGSESGSPNEKYVHFVHIDAFWIDQTEVTNAMYAKCVDAGECNLPASKTSSTRGKYYGEPEFNNYPVVYVSWVDASAYCSWAERRLPTEAEWEKAARGMDPRIYPWGNKAPNNNLLNYNNVKHDTTEVGKYKDGASPYGALDMAGNVWEWVNDWYAFGYYQTSPPSNPQGPPSGEFRVLRGGSWSDSDSNVRSTARYSGNPSNYLDRYGFRCARSDE